MKQSARQAVCSSGCWVAWFDTLVNEAKGHDPLDPVVGWPSVLSLGRLKHENR